MKGPSPSGKCGCGGPGRWPCIARHVSPAHGGKTDRPSTLSGHGRTPADRLHRRRVHAPLPARAQAAAGAPNVIVIVLDDTGFGHLGAFGSDIGTPHIDALAAGGALFNRFHVTSLCSPTRASFFTGRNHHAVGMGFLADIPLGFPGYHARLPKTAATLPRLLRDAGLLDPGRGQVAPHPAVAAVGRRTVRHLAPRRRVRALLRVPAGRHQPLDAEPGLRQPLHRRRPAGPRRATT